MILFQNQRIINLVTLIIKRNKKIENNAVLPAVNTWHVWLGLGSVDVDASPSPLLTLYEKKSLLYRGRVEQRTN
jgi:hypothetical protein